jgi:hypothetical protein
MQNQTIKIHSPSFRRTRGFADRLSSLLQENGISFYERKSSDKWEISFEKFELEFVPDPFFKND